ncbi:MAG: HAMP domain-containing sensor histidine kinase [Hyphomicrobiaceae bacterium]
MLGGPIGTGNANSLMSEYSLRLGDAVLRGRMRAAEQVARLESEIATRIKSEFISNMSHELRTPLNTVIGFSKLLAEYDQRPLSSDEIVEYARLINDAAANLLSIINDILDMSKIQAGHFRLDAVDVNLEEILEAVVASLRNVANVSGVNMHLTLPDEAIVLRGDVQKLRQIFTNLITNAVKFTPDGGEVYIDAEFESDGQVAVHVRDTGIGMDEDELDVALAPFGQVDGTRARWREGTGLGLPIAKALIEMHGGTLAITSAKSMGTEVGVKLPTKDLVVLLQQDIGIRTQQV